MSNLAFVDRFPWTLFYAKGGGVEKFVPSFSLRFEGGKGCPRNSAGISWTPEGVQKVSGPFFHPQPPSLLFLLSEPGSERKVLTKET